MLRDLWPDGSRVKGPCEGVCGVIHNAGCYADASCGVDVYDGGKRDPDDLLSCPHYPLQGFAIRDGATINMVERQINYHYYDYYDYNM